jgi:hypothetical protein
VDLAIQWCTYLVGLPLELLTIRAMLRGGLRSYPLLFAYVVASFLTTVAEMPSSLAFYHDRRNAQLAITYAWWYWHDEAILTVILFALVISLIYYATADLRSRRIVRSGLICAALLFIGVSFAVHYQPPAPLVSYGIWASPWTRDLKLCASILDLLLWMMLLAARRKDRRLLTLACALGIMFAGEAIGESVRQMAISSKNHWIADPGGVLTVLADLTFFYIAWRVFRAPATQSSPQKGAAQTSGSSS